MYTTHSHPFAPRLSRVRWSRLPVSPVRLAAVWYDRWITRQELGGLDDRILNDVGLDRDTVRREAAKPFWMA